MEYKPYISLLTRVTTTRGIAFFQLLLTTLFVPSSIFASYSVCLTLVTLSLFNVNNVIDQYYLCSKSSSQLLLRDVFAARVLSAIPQTLILILLILFSLPKLNFSDTLSCNLTLCLAFIPFLDSLISPSIVACNKQLMYTQSNTAFVLSSLLEFLVFLCLFLTRQYYIALLSALIGRYIFRLLFSYIFCPVSIMRFLPVIFRRNHVLLIYRRSLHLILSQPIKLFSSNIIVILLSRTIALDLLGLIQKLFWSFQFSVSEISQLTHVLFLPKISSMVRLDTLRTSYYRVIKISSILSFLAATVSLIFVFLIILRNQPLPAPSIQLFLFVNFLLLRLYCQISGLQYEVLRALHLQKSILSLNIIRTLALIFSLMLLFSFGQSFAFLKISLALLFADLAVTVITYIRIQLLGLLTIRPYYFLSALVLFSVQSVFVWSFFSFFNSLHV